MIALGFCALALIGALRVVYLVKRTLTRACTALATKARLAWDSFTARKPRTRDARDDGSAEGARAMLILAAAIAALVQDREGSHGSPGTVASSAPERRAAPGTRTSRSGSEFRMVTK